MKLGKKQLITSKLPKYAVQGGFLFPANLVKDRNSVRYVKPDDVLRMGIKVKHAPQTHLIREDEMWLLSDLLEVMV